MLVCGISAPHRIRADISEAGTAIDAVGFEASIFVADIAEIVTAIDDVTNGLFFFPALVDDPASSSDMVDAYLGEIMLEAASADDSVSGGFVYDATVAEVASGAESANATITPAVTATTFNPGDLSGITLSNGNLTANAPGGTGGVRGTASHTSGKNYWEYKLNAISTNSLSLGIALASANLTGGTSTGCAVVNRLGSVSVNNAGTGISLGTRAVNDVIGVAVDFGAALIWFRVAPSGNWNANASFDPATGTGGISISALSGAKFPVFINGQAGDQVTANFGATGFTGSVPSGFTSGF
jgi:hypothetical protein